jgi:hypothetical protein
VNDDTNFAKAHQAIGEYFSEFSELERELGEAVKMVLHLDGHDAADIVVAALRYPSMKASLVRAAAEIAKKKDGSETSTEWKTKADKTLKEIIKHSDGTRNTLAHSLLKPREDGLVDVTSRTLSHTGQMTPEATKPWNLKDEIDEVRRLTEGLRDIRAELSKLEVQVGKIQFAQAVLGPPYDLTQSPLLTLREHAAANRTGVPTKTPTATRGK